MKIKRICHPLRGEITVPGDKSISHRGIMLGSLSKGDTRITNFLNGADCLSTIHCFQNMGISIEEDPSGIIIHGKGLNGLSEPCRTLDVGNSGTTLRLLSGILSGQSFDSTITGDASIRKRPMERIMTPLSMMKGTVESIHNNGCAPLKISGRNLRSIHYDSPIASAQVKSCVLLAGLYGDGITSVTEPYLSRNHTELMVNYFGGSVTTKDKTISITPQPELTGRDVTVPGDISSAAYWIAAALLIPGSELLIKNVGINPTRNGILTVCKNMGADIHILNQTTRAGETAGDILVKYSPLKGTTIQGELIPALIDELPVISLLAAFAEGTTVIRDAQELKVKESNRLDIMVHMLSAMGCRVEGTEDGMIIEGGKSLTGITVDSCQDHRIAMTFSIAGLAVKDMNILNTECVSISYPDFYRQLYDF